VRALQWLTPPPDIAVEHAVALLDSLHADGERGKQMARFPLPPRLACVVMEAAARGVADDGCLAAALLSAGASVERSDLLEAMDVQHGTVADARPDHRVKQVAQQLRRIAGNHNTHKGSDEALLMSVLAGFPDRVARKRSGKVVMLSNGVAAEVQGEPPPYEFMVVLDAEDRKDKPMPLVRMTARVEPDCLIDLFPDRVKEVSVLNWNRGATRVEAVSEMRYDTLLLQEWRDAKPDTEAASAMLAEKVMEFGIARFVEEEALENLQARAAFAGLPLVDALEELRQLCMGLSTFSFAELRKAAETLIPILEAKLDGQRLRELAPATLKLKQGKPMKVHYETGKPPWVEARMQDFFGTKDGPKIGPEQTPVVMHLLGPNHRAVQTTSDLRGFWERLYPEVRRSLMRRYPKHQWPEKPV